MRLRVLIVEDSADDAKLLVRVLTKEGFEVTSRRVDTQEAMKATLDAEEWDVVLADHTMPEFDALRALSTLQRSGKDLPFIIVSGLIGEEVAVEAMRAGAHDYIIKDKLARLAPAIERELREATVRRERRKADEALLRAYAELETRVEQRTAELARDNEQLVRSALAAKEAAQREQALGKQLRAQSRELQRAAAIIESSDDAIIGKTLDGIITSWNAGAERLYGYRSPEVIGRPIAILVPPNRPDELPGILERLKRGESVEHYETVRRGKDGVLIDVSLTASPIKDPAGQVIGASAIAHDIRDRKRAEQRLLKAQEDIQAQNEQLRAQNDALRVAYHEAAEAQVRTEEIRQQIESVLRQMPSGVIIAEAGTGKIILANEQVECFWQQAAVTVEDYRKRAFHHDGRRYEAEEWPLERAMRRDEIVANEEIDFLGSDGSYRTLSVSAATIRDRDGHIIAAVAIFHDVTERRELDRLKDQFIAVAAHELKTPVAIMKGYSQALLRRADVVAPQIRTMLEAIDRGSDRIASVVQDLLDISKLHAGRLDLAVEPVDLLGMVTEIVDRAALLTEKHRIRLVKAEPVVVQGDRHRLEQVLAHLIDNATKYSPHGGEIDVAVALADHEAVVTVTDHGVGIPKDRQARIFQRFYSAHTNTPYDYGGMGVGLYISKEIVERHAGRMWFESQEGKGSTFSFTLPLA